MLHTIPVDTYTKGTVPFVYLLTFFNRKFPLVSDLGMEDFLYLSTRFSKDKPGILLKALIFRRKRYDVLLKEEKPPSYPLKSLEIAEITGKPHNDVLKAIRKMEQAWVKVTQGNFSLSTYSTFETASLRY